MFSVRQATVEDAFAISVLRCELLQEDGPEQPLRDDWQAGMVTETLALFECGKAIAVIAEDRGLPVGFIGGVVVDSSAVFEPFLMGFGIYVRPMHRGGGVLRGMFSLIKSLCDDAGVHNARITTKHDPGVFRRFGFRYVSNVLSLGGK